MHIHIKIHIHSAQLPFKISYDGAVVQACHVEIVFMKPVNDYCVRGT